MNIIESLVPKTKWQNKCPYEMEPEFIVIHNTANDASAEKEVAFMLSNDNFISFHVAVDDKKIIKAIPFNRNAWHAGDGDKGKGNRKGIAIEICFSKSGGDRFLKAEENAAEFVALVLKQHGWGIDRVKKHQDFSEKYCPHRTLDMGWERFLKKVESYMQTELTTVNDIVWELANRGIITDKNLWLKKFQADEDAYWLAKKCVNYISQGGK